MKKNGKGELTYNHLSEAARKWVESVHAEYELSRHDAMRVLIAAESWDLAAECRKVLAELGMTYIDDRKNVKQRPEISIANQARNLFLRTIRELAFDTEGPTEYWSRPGGR